MIETPYINRNSLRLVPEDFRDYHITVSIDSQPFYGYIGNISETGVLALFPFQEAQINTETHKPLKTDSIAEVFEKKTLQTHLTKHSHLHGTISSQKFHVEFQFEGEIVWAELRSHKKNDFFAIGIHFDTAFILPDALYALSVAES